jgi:UDP-2,3-diacylglucosamine hydrolase
MRRVFIADAHLRKPDDKNYQLLVRFLSELRGSTKTLYILGDLFEFWIGYGEQAFPHYRPILDGLRELTESGVEIVYFEGNHDFHLGSFFTETLQATIYPSHATIDLDGKNVYMCHGDQINKQDYGYRFLRFLLHNRATKKLFPLFPSSLVFRIADHLSCHSKTYHQQRNSRWDYQALLENFADSRFQNGYDAIVTAHFHLPLLSVAKNGKTLLSLGDWITQFTYGEFSEGKFSLHSYR